MSKSFDSIDVCRKCTVGQLFIHVLELHHIIIRSMEKTAVKQESGIVWKWPLIKRYMSIELKEMRKGADQICVCGREVFQAQGTANEKSQR